MLEPAGRHAVLRETGRGHDVRHHQYWNDDGSWAFLMFFAMLAVLAGVVILVILLMRSRHADTVVHPAGAGAQPPFVPAAEQILAERFARGEIDEHEYHQRLDALRGGNRPLVKP
jgi:putative membrane protein